MTIRKRLARSNLIMILIPMAIAAALLLLGGGLAVLLLKRVYLPRLGLSMAALHETGERLEAAFDGAKTIAAIYGGTVILALLAASGFTNLYLTKHLFRHIQKPLDILVSGVKRIQEGNLDAPIGYVVPDEFKPACDAVDEMAARLKTSLEAQSRQQQQKQELIARMSHDLKSPLTSIRAFSAASNCSRVFEPRGSGLISVTLAAHSRGIRLRYSAQPSLTQPGWRWPTASTLSFIQRQPVPPPSCAGRALPARALRGCSTGAPSVA